MKDQDKEKTFFTAAISTTFKNTDIQAEEYSVAFNGQSTWTMEREELILLRDTINNLLNKEGGMNHE